MSERLLATKYALPPLRRSSIARDDLRARLDAACGVVLVCAPAGYGKTTLVAGWARRRDAATAWLTLDEGDSDPAVFVAYLIASVREAIPDADLPEPSTALTGGNPRSTLVTLLNVLARRPERVAMVLDDYHLVDSGPVLELTAFLAGHLPPNLQLLVLSRHDPPLPAARLRARGELTEIRLDDLRFDASESARFFAETLALKLPAETIDRLAGRTEGWPAGLQLAGLSLRNRDDVEAFVETFGGSDRFVLDYLSDEVLSQLPADLREFLLRTCVLERLSGPLCDALTSRSDGAETLAELERLNLFVVPLDDRREWYRYHGLFADLLRAGLRRDDEIEARRAAAAWLVDHGLHGEAVRQAVAARDHKQAAALMSRIAAETLARGEFATILGWCETLPDEVLSANPELELVRAWAWFFVGDVRAAEATSGAISPDSLPGPLAGQLHALRAWLGNRLDRPDVEAVARRAIELLDPDDAVFAGLAWTTLGETLLGVAAPEAFAAFERAAVLARGLEGTALWSAITGNSAQAELVLGRRRDAIARCRTAIDAPSGKRAVASGTIGLVENALGMALYDGNELAAARQLFHAGREHCERAGLRVAAFGTPDWFEILTVHALGETEAAWRRLEAVRREAERHDVPRVRLALPFLAVDLALREADVRRAKQLGETLPEAISRVRGSLNDFAPVTRAGLLLADGRPGAAADLLERHAAWQRDARRLGRLVSTLLLRAAALEALGRDADALLCVEEATGHAAREGRLRPFVEHAAVARRWLPEVGPSAAAFVEEALRHIGDHAGAMTTRRSPLVEPLSARELEILRLVAAGLSNDQIGRELYIGTGTVKWHVHNLLGKLDARDRLNLARRARELGLVR